MSIEETVEERVGPYLLLERVGEGGMGVVYRAAAPLGGEDVAVKVFKPEFARDRDFRRRLEREVETMRRIRSPHVVGVLDAHLGAERPYIVTTFVDGRTLEEIVRAAGPLTRPALERVASGLARALVAIHAAGVVHRDLKPNNVMLVRGEPVVIDFGIAHAADSTRLTRTGMIVGTPGYLAPEVIDGVRPGPAVDVYAWGGTLAFAATARQPFGTGSLQAILARIVSGHPDLDGIPEGLSDGVAAALSKDPAERPSAGQLVAWLDSAGAFTAPTFAPEEPSAPAPASSPPIQTSPASPGPASSGSASPRPDSSGPAFPTPASPGPASPASPVSPVSSVGGEEVGEWSAVYARPKLDPAEDAPPAEPSRTDTNTSGVGRPYRQSPPRPTGPHDPRAASSAPPRPPADQPSAQGASRVGQPSAPTSPRHEQAAVAPRQVGFGWYKLIGYLVILTLVAWTVEIPGFFGLWVCGAAWYLRAGDAALQTLPPPGRDWRAFALAPLRRPGTLVGSAFRTGLTLVAAVIVGSLLGAVLDAPGSTLGTHVASSWGVAAGAYLMLAGPKVMAPRRHLVRLVWAATPRWETTRTVAIIAAALAMVFGMTAAADPGAPHWRGKSTQQQGGASVSGQNAPRQVVHHGLTGAKKRRKAATG